MSDRVADSLREIRERAERLNESYERLAPSDEFWPRWFARDVLALVEVAEASRRVAEEREGHELGGESALYVKLLALDEALSKLGGTQ